MLLFALYRERAGTGDLWLELPAGATVAHAAQAILGRFPGLAPGPDGIVVAVNSEYARPDQPLKDGDELALIPPVSGGAGSTLHPHAANVTERELCAPALGRHAQSFLAGPSSLGGLHG